MKVNPGRRPQTLASLRRDLREARGTIERLNAELDEKLAEAEALARVGEATGSAFELEDMLKAAADIAVSITGTDSCQVYLRDPQRDELVLRSADESSASLVGSLRLQLGEGITGWVARERTPAAVSRGAYNDPRFKFFAEMHEGEYESMLSVPLVARGEILGVINVRTHEPHDYTRHQIRLLSGIANQVAGAVERSRRDTQFERHVVQLHTLSEVSQAIATNMYLEELVQFLVSVTARTMGYRVCTVMLLEHGGETLRVRAVHGDDPVPAARAVLPVGESIAGRAAAEKTTVTVHDISRAPDLVLPDITHRSAIRSAACIPLLFQGNVVGVLSCYTERPHTFMSGELLILQALGTQAALAVEHSRLMVRSAVVQEMHHRVKNNLQQIASVVRLQLRTSQYKSVEAALNDTLSRILAISAVHELLTRDDVDRVDMRRVAETILQATQQSVVPPGHVIHTLVAGPSVELPLQKATAMALVINELVQNSVEHGFRHRTEGRVHIELFEDETQVVFTVLNDGEPLPPGFSPTATDRLGLSIVETLVRGDLHGTFTLENDDAARAIVARVAIPR